MRKCVLALLLVLGFAATAQASLIRYQVALTGPNEVPPNASPGTGFALITFDDFLNTMLVQVTFSGLLSTTTASHIHCCTAVPLTGTAGVATQTPTFTLFPLGVTSGTYEHLFDMSLASSYNSAFITANGGSVATAEPVLLAGILNGQAYLNIHTNQFPNGEIRGFLTPTAVPEPATLTLVGVGLLGFVRRAIRK